MAAFDTALTPVGVTPSTMGDTTLDPGQSDDCSVLVDVALIDSTSPGSPGDLDQALIRVGITPSGGSVHWKIFDAPIRFQAGDDLGSLGPYFLQVGDVITVGTDAPNDTTFSLTGVESSLP